MSISLTNESKNSVTITNEEKGNLSLPFSLANFTFADAVGTFGNLRTPLTKQSKDTITITNQNKT